jgi:hypothetical protein
VNQDVFDTFRTALHRRRRIVFSGLFKEGAALYDAGELDYLLKKMIQFTSGLLSIFGIMRL